MNFSLNVYIPLCSTKKNPLSRSPTHTLQVPYTHPTSPLHTPYKSPTHTLQVPYTHPTSPLHTPYKSSTHTLQVLYTHPTSPLHGVDEGVLRLHPLCSTRHPEVTGFGSLCYTTISFLKRFFSNFPGSMYHKKMRSTGFVIQRFSFEIAGFLRFLSARV